MTRRTLTPAAGVVITLTDDTGVETLTDDAGSEELSTDWPSQTQLALTSTTSRFVLEVDDG